MGKKKKDKPQSVLYGLGSPVRLVHSLEGRVRFHVDTLKGASLRCQRLVQQLEGIEGVHSVMADSRTGSIVINYNKTKLKPDLLAAAIIRLLGLENQLRQYPQARLVKETRRFGNALNSAIYDKTGGLIDFWSLVPLLFIGLGVRKLATDRNNMFPTGVTLLWWGYNSLFGGGRGER